MGAWLFCFVFLTLYKANPSVSDGVVSGGSLGFNPVAEGDYAISVTKRSAIFISLSPGAVQEHRA